MKIAVILGGTSAERDVSLSSGVAIAGALAARGHMVEAIDCAYGDKRLDFQRMDTEDLVRVSPSDIEKEKDTLDRNIFKTIDYLTAEEFDLVFIALHGGYGENGKLQAMLDLAKIPYAGSGSLASALALDKNLAKVLFRSHGIPVAPWQLLTHPEQTDEEVLERIGVPLVVKPNEQGSTVGLSIVRSADRLIPAIDTAFAFGDRVLLEKYIPGKEITVAILGDQPLPIIEIVPRSGFYDYESKYQGGKTRYVVPAELPPDLARRIQQAAFQACEILRCSGYARVDLRLQDDGQFFCLEVNTLPGMTATSLVPKAAKAVGIDFPALIERIVELAFVKGG